VSSTNQDSRTTDNFLCCANAFHSPEISQLSSYPARRSVERGDCLCFRVTFLFCSCVTFTSSPICIHLWASMMTQCLSCSPRHFGTGEFSPPQHNKRTIPSGSRLQAHQIRHCGAPAFAHTIKTSFHFSLPLNMAYGFWNLRSLPYPLQYHLSNTAFPTHPLQRRLLTSSGCCGTVHTQYCKICLPTAYAASLQK